MQPGFRSTGESRSGLLPEQTARLTGVSRNLLAGWHRSGLSTPRYVDESGLLGVKRLYSFRDIVALRTLLSLRDDYGVATDDLRKANEFLQQHYEEPWHTLKFYVLDHKLFFEEPSTQLLMSTTRPWQQVLNFPLEPIIRTVEDAVRKETERQPEQIGRITARGLIDGTRIPARAIWSFHTDGRSLDVIRDAYPTLEPEDIEAAIAHERARRHASPRRIA